MAEHIKLAHDNTRSGDWSRIERTKVATDDLRRAVDAIKTGVDQNSGIFITRKWIDLSQSEDIKIALGELDTPKTEDHTQHMTDITDYRHELKLRDDSLRKELDLRQEAFRAEQAVRDKALDDRFAGFFAAQAERDKSFEKVSDARMDRIEKDVASIKADAKTITTDVQGIKVTMAKYLGAAVVIGALASGLLGFALKQLLP